MFRYREYTRRVGVEGLVLLRWGIRRCMCGKFLGLHQHYCNKCAIRKRRETWVNYTHSNKGKERTKRLNINGSLR